ncbi:M48 family metallopeptidase [Bdellovibrio sp. SKB1291214]|uniref:M48 family metallopeptidase n=1 Tax=Bdellovibrio sp. SKB1291214 TaxID=1732569 RepID=UPI000B518BFA|nr:M48 family metallopeptidase [Bdellovibrio sp. SKB1291214]UYL08507.1 M48 family metallopeptidase [Bdellovibrio sp. SKB1291214]
MKNTVFKFLFSTLVTIFISGCATSTDEGAVGANRRQLMLVGSAEINQAAAQSYEQTKKEAQAKGTLDKNPAQLKRVQTIANKIIPQTGIFRKDALGWQWEVHIITSNDINAYCMPGGKIIFYTGIIEKLNMTDGEIAAVMGHEIAHALREHGRERYSEEIVKQGLFQIGVVTNVLNPNYVGALDMLSNLAVTLPHGRGQETEADTVGVELMARAGYNPEEALSLWKKMGSNGGSKPPEILSTHPADGTRLNHIASLLPKVMPLYQATKK